MDYIKDGQNSLEIVKFVESQSARTNPFGENRVGERAYRRCERIAAALILLTNHVSEDEPLRLDIRSQASRLLSHVLDLRDEMRALNSEKVRTLKSSIRELISLSRLLAVSGFISFQNAAAVSDALDELSSFLVASQRSNLSESASFSREDFLDVREKSRVSAYRHRGREMSDSSIKDDSALTDTEGHTPTIENRASTSSDKGQSQPPAHTARMHAIIEVLHVSGELGIRDIASNLPEYSEKMIQRELANMVESGQVRKAGSKRWSTYTLAS